MYLKSSLVIVTSLFFYSKVDGHIECVLNKNDFYNHNWHCNPECEVAATGSDLPAPYTGKLEGNTIWYFLGTENYPNQAIYKNFTGDDGYEDIFFYMEYYNGVGTNENDTQMYVVPVDNNYIQFLPQSSTDNWSTLFVKVDSQAIQNMLFEFGAFNTTADDIMLVRQLAVSYGRTTQEHIQEYCTELEQFGSTTTDITESTPDWTVSTIEPWTTTEPTDTTASGLSSISTEYPHTTDSADSTEFPNTIETTTSTTTEKPYSGSHCINDVDTFKKFWGFHPSIITLNDPENNPPVSIPNIPSADDEYKIFCVRGEDSPAYIYHNLSIWNDVVGLDLDEIFEISIYLKSYFHVPGSYVSFYPTLTPIRESQKRTFLPPSPKGIWNEDVIHVSTVEAIAYQLEGTTNYMCKDTYWCFQKIVIFINQKMMQFDVDNCT